MDRRGRSKSREKRPGVMQKAKKKFTQTVDVMRRSLSRNRTEQVGEQQDGLPPSDSQPGTSASSHRSPSQRIYKTRTPTTPRNRFKHERTALSSRTSTEPTDSELDADETTRLVKKPTKQDVIKKQKKMEQLKKKEKEDYKARKKEMIAEQGGLPPITFCEFRTVDNSVNSTNMTSFDSETPSVCTSLPISPEPSPRTLPGQSQRPGPSTQYDQDSVWPGAEDQQSMSQVDGQWVATFGETPRQVGRDEEPTETNTNTESTGAVDELTDPAQKTDDSAEKPSGFGADMDIEYADESDDNSAGPTDKIDAMSQRSTDEYL